MLSANTSISLWPTRPRSVLRLPSTSMTMSCTLRTHTAPAIKPQQVACASGPGGNEQPSVYISGLNERHNWLRVVLPEEG